ncbi:hypothetical protein ACIQW9_04765 [Herminiimonas sp. NPDC097707]|uniref:hypothetical protein n=1 Tax=Herminiimonas sp. NPDC097707 TaxID=3364007 RepID=UPI00383AD985
MSTRKMFAGMDAESRYFYEKIINTAMLNMYAVDHQLFDTRLCDSDDPLIMLKWKEVEPLIMDAIRNQVDPDPDADK